MITLRYGNTNTYFVEGTAGGLLVDTDWAGTLPRFFRAVKEAGIDFDRITHVLATHYHPDHAGLVGELQRRGVKLLLLDTQVHAVHDADGIFRREGRRDYVPVDEGAADVVFSSASRAYLGGLGIGGEIFPTPSHSADSVSAFFDDGTCLVGDLEPFGYLAAYGDNPALRADWDAVKRRAPKRILFGHGEGRNGASYEGQ